jgi:hypothetical protein
MKIWKLKEEVPYTVNCNSYFSINDIPLCYMENKREVQTVNCNYFLTNKVFYLPTDAQ